ncbi:uncharacterized protein K02A2.6-like [Toxorhynchites rutilus septentrionalis]|uniref:uncharacterized protein K02A2.6-like n=1 Tax=Toxorhynchites rutilus septentrionalis TaxID=329112 RepID=UPI00247A25E5|nr:uncharacterized protein K02A2.6-like [Toxorhynchites rutilus septentrionalis]
MNIADVFSRLSTIQPRAFDDEEELMVREVANSAVSAIALKWDEIESASKNDPQIQRIIEALDAGMTVDLPLAFRMIFTELCRLGDILLRGDRIVIPQQLQQRVLHLAHEGHPGIRVMKGHLRASVWWPKMDQHVESFVKECRGCTLVTTPNPPEPMIRKQLPTRAWEQIAVDFLGPLPEGENLLVCVDYFSRYLEVIEMNDISTTSTIDELMIIFSRYGIPESLRADNGPQFSSDEFRNFCDEYGIRLVHSIPYWPQMNGEVEQQNRSILKRLRIAQELGKDWRRELRQYLLMCHAANHTTTGKSPSELMFGRRMRTKLPTILATSPEYDEVRDRDVVEKEKGRVYADEKRRARKSDIEVGDQVLAKRVRKENKLNADFSTAEFDVVRKSGTDVVIRSKETGEEFRRSAAHLKKLPHTNVSNNSSETLPVNNDDSINDESIIGIPADSNELASTSKRNRSEPIHFKDYLTY